MTLAAGDQRCDVVKASATRHVTCITQKCDVEVEVGVKLLKLSQRLLGCLGNATPGIIFCVVTVQIRGEKR